MATKNQQVADQTLKGAAVGALSYFLAKANIDPGAQAAIMPLVILQVLLMPAPSLVTRELLTS